MQSGRPGAADLLLRRLASAIRWLEPSALGLLSVCSGQMRRWRLPVPTEGELVCDGRPHVSFGLAVLRVEFVEACHLVEATPPHEPTLRLAFRVRAAQNAAAVCRN